jgi:hypothetical protein
MKMKDYFTTLLSTIILGSSAIFSFALIATIPMFFSWNLFFPEIFELKSINLVQAFGLSVFIYLLKTSQGNLK